MTTEWREGFGGGHESAHWSRHLWDHFRSTLTHAERMFRAFGIAPRSNPAAAEPAYVEYSNPEPEPQQPERDWSAIVTDYNEGRISAGEMGRQKDERIAQVGAEAAWEELLSAPRAEYTDAEANRMDAERERAEQRAHEAEPEAEAGW
jgi:hypothetical protein